MKLPRLLQTTALRLALRYALVYAALMGLLLAVLFWTGSRYVDSQLETGLEQELYSLARKFDNGGLQHLAETVSQREEHGRRKAATTCWSDLTASGSPVTCLPGRPTARSPTMTRCTVSGWRTTSFPVKNTSMTPIGP